MSVIAPTVTAYDLHEYRRQIETISKFASRIHIDLMDGIFAPTKSPDIGSIWLAEGLTCDVHLMFQHPYNQIKKILRLDPALVVIQAEADTESVELFIRAIKKTKMRVGVSLLPETDVRDARITELIRRADHALLFSGHLGYHGGVADLELLDKVRQIQTIKPKIEIGWDGGINDNNITALQKGGIDVLNVGGAVQKAEDPEAAYDQLAALINHV